MNYFKNRRMRKNRVLVFRWLQRLSVLDIALIMTLILLFIYTEDVLNIRMMVQVLSVAGLILYKYIGKHPLFWLIITGILAYGHSYLWFSIDNHKYLMNYWTLAITLSLFSRQPEINLKTNGRLLIGLCFLFAVIWKAFTPEFINGSFFEFLIIGGDSRFHDFSQRLSAIPYNFMRYNEYLINYTKGDLRVESMLLESSSRLRVIAIILTWWTLLIEGTIAILFLWKHEDQTRYTRDIILITFIVTTYPVASVIGFAWLLTAMGASQICSRSILMKLTYLSLFIFLTHFSSSAIRYLKIAKFYLTIH